MKSKTEVTYDYMRWAKERNIPIVTDTLFSATVQPNGYTKYDDYPLNQICDHIIIPPKTDN